MQYADREHAGKQLAEALQQFRDKKSVVLALPRGGVVLGAEVARRLAAPLGLVLVRKLGHWFDPEYAVGAVAEGGPPVLSQAEVATAPKGWLEGAVLGARELIEKRRTLYYGKDFPPPSIRAKTVIIVDDGIATGLTMQAAVQAVQARSPREVIVAVPVAARESVEPLKQLGARVITLDEPAHFLGAVGAHYQTFEQVDDETVKTILRSVRDENKRAQ